MKKRIRVVLSGLLLAVAGCAGAATQQSAPSGVEQVYGGTLNQCRTELALLKPLNPALYQQQEKALDGDLASATQYLLMRGRLNVGMQETLDRLHQANLMRTCQQVHNVLFNQLLDKSTVAVSPGGKRQ
ncbi:TPA: hypothetical protein G8V61_004106 [Salmonella enterica]|nr:hypothetical protein [Salmonella enterica]